MGLNFIGERGVYLPDRDAIKITALDGDHVVDCYATRSALDALGCTSSLTAETMIEKFEVHRTDIEVAAMIKCRRSLGLVIALEVTAEDLRALAPSSGTVPSSRLKRTVSQGFA